MPNNNQDLLYVKDYIQIFRSIKNDFTLEPEANDKFLDKGFFKTLIAKEYETEFGEEYKMYFASPKDLHECLRYDLNHQNNEEEIGSILTYYWNYLVEHSSDHKVYITPAICDNILLLLNYYERILLTHVFSEPVEHIDKVVIVSDTTLYNFPHEASDFQELTIQQDGTIKLVQGTVPAVIFRKEIDTPQDFSLNSKENPIIDFGEDGLPLRYPLQNFHKETLHFDPEICKEIIDDINASSDYIEYDCTEIAPGNWTLEITDIKGNIYTAEGELNSITPHFVKLSTKIRHLLQRPQLMLFDNHVDEITTLTMSYTHHTKYPDIVPNYLLIGENESLPYQETITLDRINNKLHYEKIYNNKFSCISTYTLPEVLDELLDFVPIEPESLHDKLLVNKTDFSNETHYRTYHLTLESHGTIVSEIFNIYDDLGLPEWWEEFIYQLRRLTNNNLQGALLNLDLCRRARFHTKDYIYCEVIFDFKKDSAYHYLALEDEYFVGDEVLVPVGPSDTTTIGKIISVKYYPKFNVPYPVDKTKAIIRKYYPEE